MSTDSAKKSAERGRVVLVTGAASGIGRQIAAALAARGDRVAAADIDEAALARAELGPGTSPGTSPGPSPGETGTPGPGVLRLRLDVRDPDDWQRALDRTEAAYGPLDVLLNVAGVLRPGYLHTVTPADIALHLDVNVKGVALGLQAAAARMVARRRGHIVNVGSLASLAPVSGLGLYAASKFAVRGLSLAAAQDLQPHGVAVTLVMPDAVQTPMLDLQVDRPEAALTFSGGRSLTAAEVAQAVLRAIDTPPGAPPGARPPLEVALPAGRALLARLAGAFPGPMLLLAPLLARRGRARQDAIRQRRDQS